MTWTHIVPTRGIRFGLKVVAIEVLIIALIVLVAWIYALFPLARCRYEQVVTPWYGYTRCR